MSSDFRRDINGLRGLSVLLVVAFHLQLRGSWGGYIGVDVFFVISGYLMTKIIWEALVADRYSYWGFVAARAARIWPALTALVIGLLAIGAFVLPPFDLEILSQQAVQALLFWSNHFFRDGSGYNTERADTTWLLHTWSLSVEWQFYLLYPLLLWGAVGLGRRLQPTRPVRALQRSVVVLLVVVLALSLGCQLAWTTSDPVSAFFLLPARAWQLVAGGLVYFLANRSAAPVRAAASYAGLALIVASALVLGYLHVAPIGIGWLALMPVAGVALVLWANHHDNAVLGHWTAQTLGAWSYSIYLWHWPLVVGLRVTGLFNERPLTAAAIVVIGSLALGGLSFRFIEPMARRGRRSPLKVAFKPIVAMAAAGTLSAAALATNGLAVRNGDREDFYRGYRSAIEPLGFPLRCSNFRKPVHEMIMCPVTKPGPRRVLVIGDSHAEHLYPWFVRHGSVSVDFFTASECPPVPSFDRRQAGFDCMNYAALAWRTAALAQYDTVIVSARWATVALNGPPYCHYGAEVRCEPAPKIKQDLVRAELRSAIEHLLRAGKTVVVLDGAPESRFRVPERLARESFWYGQIRLTIDRRAMLDTTAWIDGLFDELKREPGFHLVSLRDKLCRGSTCRVFDTEMKRPIYTDESHFDPVWIAADAELFAPFVRSERR